MLVIQLSLRLLHSIRKWPFHFNRQQIIDSKSNYTKIVCASRTHSIRRITTISVVEWRCKSPFSYIFHPRNTTLYSYCMSYSLYIPCLQLPLPSLRLQWPVAQARKAVIRKTNNSMLFTLKRIFDSFIQSRTKPKNSRDTMFNDLSGAKYPVNSFIHYKNHPRPWTPNAYFCKWTLRKAATDTGWMPNEFPTTFVHLFHHRSNASNLFITISQLDGATIASERDDCGAAAFAVHIKHFDNHSI